MKTFDLESYPNFFLAVFKDYRTKKYDVFEISDRKNEYDLLLNYLKLNRNEWFCGFNIINYDYPVIHNTIFKGIKDPQKIFNISDSTVKTKYSSIRPYEVKLNLIDLFKVWHYDNKNKSTSLKWLEFAFKMNSIEDLPYPVGSILTDTEKDNVIKYCYHDVDATEQFLDKSLELLTLRKDYTQIQKENMMNYSEIAISKAIFLDALAPELGISKKELSQLRSNRTEVKIKEIIFDYIKFNDPVNNKVLDTFKSKVWRYNDDEEISSESISFNIPYKNVIREYAEGGLHSFGKPGIYYSDDDYVLIDVDFASYYPHITFKNNLHPEHIPERIFNKKYEGFYIDRLKYSKSDPRNKVLKIVLNGSYGLSKDKYSFLYDPRWQLQICINGQLILTYLTEKVFDVIPDAQIIFENTDGAMYRIKRSDIDKLEKVCKEVTEVVNIPLETQECNKIIIRDVNNYINIIDDETVKYKGCFEINRDFHKNHSKRIVPLALANYYINGITPENTIKDHLSGVKYNIIMDKKAHVNIEKSEDFYQNYGLFDFCIGSKMKGKNKLYKRYSFDTKQIKEFTDLQKRKIVLKNGFKEYLGSYQRIEQSSTYSSTTYFTLDQAFNETMIATGYTYDEPLNKTNRYIVVKNGIKLIKVLPPLDKSFKTKTDLYKEKFDPNQLNIFDMEDVTDVKVNPNDRESELEVNFKCEVVNKIPSQQSYEYDKFINSMIDNIDYDYYISECYKIIDKVKN